jgi:hypothetical protein
LTYSRAQRFGKQENPRREKAGGRKVSARTFDYRAETVYVGWYLSPILARSGSDSCRVLVRRYVGNVSGRV